jgi:hypothetical protein
MATLDTLLKIRDIAISKMDEIIKNFAEKTDAIGAEDQSATVAPVSVVAVAPPAPTARTVEVLETKTRKGWKGGVNKSQLIRDYFAKHGKDSRPRDVLEYLKADHGISVSPVLVSIIKSQIGGKTVKTKKDKATKTKARAVRHKASDLPLTALCADLLKNSRDGFKLSEIVTKAVKAGYKYSGKRGREGIVQNVYQALRTLRERKTHPGYVGEVSVIIHDEASKRWRLNPKAKRKTAA